MLIASPRHTPEDLRVWATRERFDDRLGWSAVMDRRIESARDAIIDFASHGPCYLGVSWGKDSVVVAALAIASGVHVPLVWVRVEAVSNPDCVLVRDTFLARFPHVEYAEITIACRRDRTGRPVGTGRLETGFAQASERFGHRYISGVRSEESGARALREAVYGIATERTCAPITRWSGGEVFAYLYREGLPVHPAYACSFGGALDRERIRVSSLGGQRGTGHGRREWEWAYYRDEMMALGEAVAVVR